MAKRRRSAAEIKGVPEASHDDGPMFISWAGSAVQRDKAFVEMGKAVGSYNGYYSAPYGQDYSDLATNVSSRPGLGRDGYDAFRPNEAIPQIGDHKAIMFMSDRSYQKVGLIKNIIDLMGDFACQGVRVVHPNPKIQRFMRSWWKKVHGKERSERFLNHLYRLGNVVIRKQTARISVKDQTEMTKKAQAKPDTKMVKDVVHKREIPWRYTFLNPITIDVVGKELSSFVGKSLYSLIIPAHLRRMITNPQTPEEIELVKELPPEIKEAARTNKPVLLPPDKTIVYHYKKDDWQTWANPMIYSIMEDINLLQKLKLADTAALDGAISNIRIFKLGSLEHKIAPTRTAAARLGEILENHMGAGTMDLIWGPDIELVESKTTVHQFLGEDKYKPTLNNIYAGLGIPPTLTGTFGAAGTTNNFISIKTLVQRLEYGREVLEEFWNNEFKLVQEAMGFRFPARLEFTWTSLGDEAAEKALLIQMVDRNLISDELFQRYFGHDEEMENIRIRREHRGRENGSLPPKAGAFYDPQFMLALKKVALQTGAVTPGQVGLKLDPKPSGEQPALKMKVPPGGTTTTKKKGAPGQGRPKNKKDSTPRKKKTFTPKSKAVMEIWADFAQSAISEVLNEGFIEHYQKKNMRSLTAKQLGMAENVKFGVLCNIEPLSEVSETTISAALQLPVSQQAVALCKEWSGEIASQMDRKLTLDELRKVQTSVCIHLSGDEYENNN